MGLGLDRLRRPSRPAPEGGPPPIARWGRPALAEALGGPAGAGALAGRVLAKQPLEASG